MSKSELKTAVITLASFVSEASIKARQATCKIFDLLFLHTIIFQCMPKEIFNARFCNSSKNDAAFPRTLLMIFGHLLLNPREPLTCGDLEATL